MHSCEVLGVKVTCNQTSEESPFNSAVSYRASGYASVETY